MPPPKGRTATTTLELQTLLKDLHSVRQHLSETVQRGKSIRTEQDARRSLAGKVGGESKPTPKPLKAAPLKPEAKEPMRHSVAMQHLVGLLHEMSELSTELEQRMAAHDNEYEYREQQHEADVDQWRRELVALYRMNTRMTAEGEKMRAELDDRRQIMHAFLEDRGELLQEAARHATAVAEENAGLEDMLEMGE